MSIEATSGGTIANAFPLLDLPSQALVVQRLLGGLSVDEKLVWLSVHGQLTPVPGSIPGAQSLYTFESAVGLRCCFFLSGDEFVFIGDHTTYRVKG